MKTSLALPAFMAVVGLTTYASAFDYDVIEVESIILEDVSTGITNLQTIFVNEDTLVQVEGMVWNATAMIDDETNSTTTISNNAYLKCKTFVDEQFATYGNLSLADVGRELPTSMDCGIISVNQGGRYTVKVEVTVVNDDEETEPASTSEEYEAYGAGVAIIPLCVILAFAVTTHMVELSLFIGIWLGACIVEGSLKGGFTSTLSTYIVEALTDEGHVYVILFTLFLSGMVAMMERSGGMYGFTKDIASYARTTRSGQFACFFVGVIIFFDDYANTLLAGKSLRPLLDTLFVSREKLSFIVDATAAPIASISPVSSWVGFEIGLIQAELDKIVAAAGTEDIGIKTSGFAVFLQSIKYRYYPIFMLILMPLLIFSQRDFASMLIAERKTQIYKRTDGGDSATEPKVKKVSTVDVDAGDALPQNEDTQNKLVAEGIGNGDNDPRKDTPFSSWNMLVPIILLIFFIFYLLVKSGETGEPDQSLMDKIENSDSYVALLYGTMGAAMCTLIFYLLQIVRGGKYICPNLTAVYQALTAGYHSADSDRARFLMSVRDSVESYIVGFGRVFPALIVLTLAWASGAIMITVGADRLFAKWITEGVAPELLPTLSFIISLFMALATGTSWGTMTILFPLLLVPTYNVSNGDEQIFYAVVAGILSGSVAGDHMSPISDTTVLSSLASDCNLLAHVSTQAPYVLIVALLAILVGTLPIGYGTWPNLVGIFIGIGCLVAFVYLVAVPVFSKNGRYDILTELLLKMRPSDDLQNLRQDCSKAAAGEEVFYPTKEQTAAKHLEEGNVVDVTASLEDTTAPKKDHSEGSSSEEFEDVMYA